MTKSIVVLIIMLAMRSDAHADKGERWDPATVAFQSVTATAGFLASAGLVALLTTKEKCEGWDCYDFSGVFLAGIAGLASVVVGTQLAGDKQDGTGTIGGTLAGTGIGIVAGIGGAVLAAKIKDNSYLVLAGFVLPIVAGSVIGYHLSADDKPVAIPLLQRSF